jgi:hypothetical protein
VIIFKDQLQLAVKLFHVTIPPAVKASNFGPHVNFGLFSEGHDITKTRTYRKMTGIKVVDKRLIYKIGSSHFWHINSPKEAADLTRNGPKFSMRFKIRGFYSTL